MPKIKTFTTELSIFKTIHQLEELDKNVNDFIATNKIQTIYALNDSITTNDKGATIGIIRSLAYD